MKEKVKVIHTHTCTHHINKNSETIKCKQKTNNVESAQRIKRQDKIFKKIIDFQLIYILLGIKLTLPCDLLYTKTSLARINFSIVSGWSIGHSFWVSEQSSSS